MELSFKVLVCVLLFGVSLRVSAYDSLRIENSGGKSYVIHKVEVGETLYSLSKRYNTKIRIIAEANNIDDYQISLGQELRVPIEVTSQPTQVAAEKPEQPEQKNVYHTVKTSETLYSLSRQYGVSVAQLREWNSLSANEIAIGQRLIVSMEGSEPLSDTKEVSFTEGADTSVSEVVFTKPADKKGNVTAKGFTEYYVQSGDLLETIARKFNVKPDSIVVWNDLPNTYLAIGQKLLVKGEPVAANQSVAANTRKTAYGTIRKRTDSSGFTKVFEEGVARKIDSSVETEKYLALHRSLPLGTLIEVRNLMNNQKVFVRVVGNLPETGLNEKVLVRLTPICFERLGVIDPKTRVEVSYYED